MTPLAVGDHVAVQTRPESWRYGKVSHVYADGATVGVVFHDMTHGNVYPASAVRRIGS